MRLSRIFLFTSIICFLTLHATSKTLITILHPDSVDVGFIASIELQDTSGKLIAPKVSFGVHSRATYCLDAIFDETELPPPPPSGISDIHFRDVRSGAGACMGGGTKIDIRHFSSTTQVDTYKVRFDPGDNGYPIKIAWNSLSNYYEGSVNLLYPLSGNLMNVDMKSEISIVIQDEISTLYILAKHPKGLISAWADSVADKSILLGARFNPLGVNTVVWFEWGIKYGTVNSTPPVVLGDGNNNVTFREVLSGLLPRTEYYIKAVIQNQFGKVMSVPIKIKTKQGSDTLNPPIIYSSGVGYISPISAVGGAMIGANGSNTYARFQWGTTTNYTDSTNWKYGPTDWRVSPVSIPIEGLTPMTTYHARVSAKNSDGITHGPDIVFKTLRIFNQPTAITLAPENVGMTSAYLRGLVNPNSEKIQVYFQCYDSENGFVLTPPPVSIDSSSRDTIITIFLQNLTPNREYFYRVQVSVEGSGSSPVSGEFYYFTTQYDSFFGGFSVPLMFKINSSYTRLLRFGVHTYGSRCLDYGLGEMELPPWPPSDRSETRFVTPPNSPPSCLALGVYIDFRKYYSSTQIDTYKIRIQPGEGEYPTELSWGDIGKYYQGQVRLIDPTGGSGFNIDMKNINSYLINEIYTSALIIAEGPINIIKSKSPEINGTTAKLTGIFNPNGETTEAWFEWGADSLYDQITTSVELGNGMQPLNFTASLMNLNTNTKYQFRPVVKKLNSTFYGIGQSFMITFTDMKENKNIPSGLVLSQNYPNPFNPVTVIKWQLANGNYTTLKVYNIVGKEVAVLVNGYKSAGNHQVTFDGSQLTSGMYFYKLQSGNNVKVRKLTLVK
ncbi:MAG: T9SS type A sorting domain-containing protein [Bacteroidota bacterium]|nr:T9SS type A sorting domain-containing protein [Bacteroidota bacterium]